jgi:hypothetical protein
MAHKIENKLVDFELVVDVPSHVYSFRSTDTVEKKMALAEEWIKEVKDLLGEHRNNPGIVLFVNPIKKDVCSNCKQEWELDSDPETKETFCAHCGSVVSDVTA